MLNRSQHYRNVHVYQLAASRYASCSRVARTMTCGVLASEADAKEENEQHVLGTR